MFHAITALDVEGKTHLPQVHEPEFASEKERLAEVNADTKARGVGWRNAGEWG